MRSTDLANLTPLSRRQLLQLSLVSGLMTLGIPVLADQDGAQGGSLQPGPGEILLEGKITGGSRKEKKMTLLVDKVISATGTQTAVDPARSREVQLTEKTGILNTLNATQALVPEGLMLNLRVSVIGKDLGVGKELTARLILIDTSTLEQRTLLERGQLAVATQTFTRLGEKAWWNFRCSDAAKATMIAYRGGLQMIVEQAAHQYDVQLQQGDLALTEGDVITVSFRARADRARTLHVEAQASGGDYPSIGLVKDIRLSTEWRPITFTFTAREIGKRNQVVFGVGHEVGTVWLEAVSVVAAPSGKKKPVAAVPVARAGTTEFTGALVSQIDLFSVIGKRYDFTRAGTQSFTLLLSSEEKPVELVPITLTARPATERLQTEDGAVTVRVLDLRRGEEKDPMGYLMIGQDGDFLKGETGSFFPEPLYRMQGPATKTETGFEMQMLEPYRDRWRVEKNGDGWKIRVLLADGKEAGFVETDGQYNPIRIQCPLGGDTAARIFSATVQAGKIVWNLPLR